VAVFLKQWIIWDPTVNASDEEKNLHGICYVLGCKKGWFSVLVNVTLSYGNNVVSIQMGT